MLNELIAKFKSYEDCEEYTSHSGKKCYRTYGDLGYYLYLCYKYNLKTESTGDFSKIAKGNGFELEYCEHDIILAID